MPKKQKQLNSFELMMMCFSCAGLTPSSPSTVTATGKEKKKISLLYNSQAFMYIPAPQKNVLKYREMLATFLEWLSNVCKEETSIFCI